LSRQGDDSLRFPDESCFWRHQTSYNGKHRACPASRKDAKTHSIRNPGDLKRSRTKDGLLAWMPLLSLAGHAFFLIVPAAHSHFPVGRTSQSVRNHHGCRDIAQCRATQPQTPATRPDIFIDQSLWTLSVQGQPLSVLHVNRVLPFLSIRRSADFTAFMEFRRPFAAPDRRPDDNSFGSRDAPGESPEFSRLFSKEGAIPRRKYSALFGRIAD
jgi:hypothetical protein